MVVRTYFKVFFASCFLALTFFALPAHAAIEPPYKEIDYCYRIDNTKSYPDFTILARIPPLAEALLRNDFFTMLRENECFSRSNRDEIVAVQTDDFVTADTRNTDVIHSGVEAPVAPIKVYDLEDQRKKIEDTFTIDALDDQRFFLRLTKRIIENDDGTVQERVYATLAEGIADMIAPGYEYEYTPPRNVYDWPDSFRTDSFRTDIFRTIDRSAFTIPYKDPWVLTFNIFRVVFGLTGVIVIALIIWSVLMWALKRDHRARYRRIALYSLLVFAVVIILEIIRYMVMYSLIRGHY